MAATEHPLAPYITPQGRDLRIDLLRGYFVFAMVVDHVRGASPLWLLTGGNRFFVGAAEGFIFVSGLMAGLVYGRRIGRDGMGQSFMKVLGRASTLYLLTLGLTFTFMPLSELLYLPWAQGVDTRNPLAIVISVLTLHRTYYLVDVLLLYTVLFLLTPLALLMIDQGKRWWVLGASWLLWGLFQLWPDYAALPWPIAGNYVFNFSAWQVLFFSGLVLGDGRKTMPVPSPRRASALLIASGVLLVGLVVLFYLVEPPTTATPESLATMSNAAPDLRALVQEIFLNKVDARPGRLLAAGVTFTFLFLLTTVFWRFAQRTVSWLLLPLGQHALYAYTVHVAFVALVALALSPLNLSNPGPQWLNALIQAVSVLLIWLMVRHQALSPTERTQRYYNLAPFLLAVAAGVAFYLDPSPNYPGLAEPAAASRPVSRFGTPLPPSAAKPKAGPAALGTPTPDTPSQIALSPTPAPTPTYETKPSELTAAMERVAPWVGTIRGSLEEHWFYSAALDREMPYWAYFPPDYNTTRRRYPVVYLLHGRGGHRDEWINYDLVAVADRGMSQGGLPPMVIIMPQGDRGFWVNNANGGPAWGDYVVQDLVAQVDSTFRTLRTPSARAIGGLSMGGFGALSLAFTHPETFGVVGAHTPSLPADGDEPVLLGMGDVFAALDPLSLANTLSSESSLRIWIDTDAADPWLLRAQQLHDTIAARQLGHFWQVFPGIHNYEYWSTHAIDYLRFYGDSLTRQ